MLAPSFAVQSALAIVPWRLADNRMLNIKADLICRVVIGKSVLQIDFILKNDSNGSAKNFLSNGLQTEGENKVCWTWES